LDQIRFGHSDDGFAIATTAGAVFNPLIDVTICRVRDGVRLGGVIFNNFTEESIMIHSASWAPRWVNRDLLFVTFDYPFNQLGVNRIFGMVPEDNSLARRFNTNLGFRYVARVEGVYKGNIACLVMCMERADCRHLLVKPLRMKPNYTGKSDGWQKQSA
jgi:RimJ/RimL family protein N-acetyltransferase